MTSGRQVLDDFFGRTRVLTADAIDALPWSAIQPASPWMAGMVRYMMHIEAHTPVLYYPSLQDTPSGREPRIAAFMERWSREETTHGELLGRYLAVAAPAYAAYVPPQIPGTGRRLLSALQKNLLGDTFITLHMLWGAINEITTEVGYTILHRDTTDPLLRSLLTLIRREEAQHARVYLALARERLSMSGWDRALVPRIVEKFWHIVGSDTEDAQSQAPVMELLSRSMDLFQKRVEGTIRLLPGCGGIELARIAREQLAAAGIGSSEVAAPSQAAAGFGRDPVRAAVRSDLTLSAQMH